MRCNLFRPLSNPTGEFFMFSQFTEDLSRQSTDGLRYRVSPARFAVLELNTSKLDGVDDRVVASTPTNSYNHAIAKVFQNYFENAYTIVREQLGQSWKPSYLNNILWTTLKKYLLDDPVVEVDGNSVTNSYFKELKYIGDIPFYNNRDVDSMNYNEIYCHIPISGKEYKYFLTRDSGESTTPYSTTNTSYITGWTQANYPTSIGIDHTPIFDYTTTNSGSYRVLGADSLIPKDLYSEDSNITTREQIESELYTFNSIIIYYDIWDCSVSTNPVIKFKNVPMGIYFTGTVNMSSTDLNKPFNNTVTKYISNVDAFGQGSAYGVRILTRNSPTPNSSTYFSEASSEQDVASLATMMGMLGDAVSEVRRSTIDTMKVVQSIKDSVAMFKNYRTNVPYIRNVDGQPMWFVNGRNTGVVAQWNSQPQVDPSFVFSNLLDLNDLTNVTWDSTEDVDVNNVLSTLEQINS